MHDILTKVFIFEPENDIGIGMMIFWYFLSKLTMLYLGPNVSALFSCMWCKSGKMKCKAKIDTCYTPHLVFILNCLSFTLKGPLTSDFP